MSFCVRVSSKVTRCDGELNVRLVCHSKRCFYNRELNSHNAWILCLVNRYHYLLILSLFFLNFPYQQWTTTYNTLVVNEGLHNKWMIHFGLIMAMTSQCTQIMGAFERTNSPDNVLQHQFAACVTKDRQSTIAYLQMCDDARVLMKCDREQDLTMHIMKTLSCMAEYDSEIAMASVNDIIADESFSNPTKQLAKKFKTIMAMNSRGDGGTAVSYTHLTLPTTPYV